MQNCTLSKTFKGIILQNLESVQFLHCVKFYNPFFNKDEIDYLYANDKEREYQQGEEIWIHDGKERVIL